MNRPISIAALLVAGFALFPGCNGGGTTGVVLDVRFANAVPEEVIDAGRTLSVAVGGAETSTDRVALTGQLAGHATASIRFRPAITSGALTFAVTVENSTGDPIGRGDATAMIGAGRDVTVSVVLEVFSPPPDLTGLGSPDLATADLSAADLSSADLVITDLANADLSMADLATVDFATAKADLAGRDLAMAKDFTAAPTDMAIPIDLATVVDFALPVDAAVPIDMAMADLTAPADLTPPADLRPPSDLTPPLDLSVPTDLFGKCAVDGDCGPGRYCPTNGFCAPKLPTGGNCTGEGDHACTIGNCVNNACSPCPKGMQFVSSGAATLGSDPKADPDAQSDEQPQHVATISAYCVDRTEVTVAAYRACVASTACMPPANTHADAAECTFTANAGALEARPINCLTWQQSKTFCEWAGDGTVHALGARRLPTEAEWEKQARGLDKRIWPWGNAAPSCSYENFDNSGNGSAYCVGTTSDVASYSMKGDSPYGTADAAGNVYEWVADWYDKHAYNACINGCSNPTGPNMGMARVIRGGSWTSPDSYTRCAFRNYQPPDKFFTNVGVRCVSQTY